MTSEASFICNPSIVFRKERDDWAFLFDPDTGNIVGLNTTGTVIWTLLEKGNDADEIAKEISIKFKMDEKICKQDILGFIADLTKRRFLFQKT